MHPLLRARHHWLARHGAHGVTRPTGSAGVIVVVICYNSQRLAETDVSTADGTLNFNARAPEFFQITGPEPGG
jgi:hypothetical protein